VFRKVDFVKLLIELQNGERRLGGSHSEKSKQ
jgi:hypothetical protein